MGRALGGQGSPGAPSPASAAAARLRRCACTLSAPAAVHSRDSGRRRSSGGGAPAPLAPVSRQREPRGSSRDRSWMTGGLMGKEKFRLRTTTDSSVSPAATEATAASGCDAVMVRAGGGGEGGRRAGGVRGGGWAGLLALCAGEKELMRPDKKQQQQCAQCGMEGAVATPQKLTGQTNWFNTRSGIK
jgi:hypothetical protein